MATTMGRKSVDCREQKSDMNCTVKISADTKEEVLESAVQHAISIHGEKDTPELRGQIKMSIQDDDMEM